MNWTGTPPRLARVVIVDDDDISRRGMASVLADAYQLEVVAALSHEGVLHGSVRWDAVDVVLVDAVDERCVDDHFPGVRVVDRIRQYRLAASPTVIVVTDHYYDDGLRRRMREARPDYFHNRACLQDGEALRQLVQQPERYSAPVPACVELEALFRHGVTDRTRVNRAVAFARERGLMALLATRPELRSRAWLRLRREFNHEARLNPVTADGRTPDRAQDYPSLPQIARFLRWATRVKTGAPADGEELYQGRRPLERRPLLLVAGGGKR